MHGGVRKFKLTGSEDQPVGEFLSSPVARIAVTSSKNLVLPAASESTLTERPEAIVIDNGATCKAGFAGDDAPRAFVPALVSDGGVVTDEEHADASASALTRPIQRGIVTDWGAMERVWHHIFHDELKVAPEEHPVLLTEAPMGPKANRERMTEIMFEVFNVSALYVHLTAVLSLYASGGTTGVVLDSGDGVSHVVPIYEGYAMPHAIIRVDLAGGDTTRAMARRLGARGHALPLAVVQQIKEQRAYVARNIEQETLMELARMARLHDDHVPRAAVAALGRAATHVEEAEERTHELADGTVVPLGDELFQSPEALFRPSLAGLEAPGLHEAINTSIMKCEIDLHRDLYQHIVLSGGCTLLHGLVERLDAELTALRRVHRASSSDVHVIAKPDRRYAVWIGGSILASLSTFAGMWISKVEYDETGPGIVHRKCF